MTANRAMALRVVWGTRLDDDTPAPDARELLEMCGLIEPGGHELMPDLSVTGRLIDEQGRPVATAPIRSAANPAPVSAAAPKRRGPGRKPIPIEHGTEHGYRQHKAKKVAIPDDDACGCQASHDARLRRPRRKSTPPSPLGDVEASGSLIPRTREPDDEIGGDEDADTEQFCSKCFAGIESSEHHEKCVAPIELAEDIRAQVDEMASRVNEDGSINARHVAIEQTLRGRHGLTSYIASLDGPGKFRPQPVSAPPQTPTEGTASASPEDDAAGTAPAPSGPGHGNAGPDAQPQVSPSRSHTGEGGGPGASDAPAEPTVTDVDPDDRTLAATAGSLPVDVDEWLAAAQRSGRPGVRRHAQIAVLALLQLRCALDDLARAERSPR